MSINLKRPLQEILSRFNLIKKTVRRPTCPPKPWRRREKILSEKRAEKCVEGSFRTGKLWFTFCSTKPFDSPFNFVQDSLRANGKSKNNIALLGFYKKTGTTFTSCKSHYRKDFYRNKVLFFVFLMHLSSLYATQKRITVMVSPTGHAQDTGRKLHDGFERGATRQLAEILKKNLEEHTDARIILTHNAGETINQEQKASFANRLNVDLYISLTVYNDDTLYIHPYFYRNEIFSPTVDNRLTFYPVKKAYLKSAKKVESLIQKQLCAPKYHSMFKIMKPRGFPLKSLEGITAPAFEFEISIKDFSDILTYEQVLSDTIRKIINDIR